MCMRTHVGIDTESHTGNLALAGGKFVDDFKLGNALYVETKDVLVQTEIDFPITFSYSCINNLVCRKAHVKGSLDFSATHAVCTQTCLTNYIEHFWVGIGLYGIMHTIALILSCLGIDFTQGGTQQVCVVIVERSSHFLKLFYWKITFHTIFLLSIFDILIH